MHDNEKIFNHIPHHHKELNYGCHQTCEVLNLHLPSDFSSTSMKNDKLGSVSWINHSY